MASEFLTYEQIDAFIKNGSEVTLAETGRALTIWTSTNHGTIYAWNGLIQEWQHIGGAYRSCRP